MDPLRATPQVADPVARDQLLRRLAMQDAAPWLHQEVARRMAERLRVILQPPTRWLDWGGYLGGSADAVAAVWPQVERQVAEPTAALLARSRQAATAPWWAWRRRQAPPVLPTGQVAEGDVPMLWANLVLPTAPDPGALLAHWHGLLATDGFLMFSSYGPDTLKTLRAMYAACGWPPPHLPYPDMHDIGDMLVHAGFADPVMDQEALQLSWSTPEAALAELRTLGANLAPDRPAGLRTPRWRARLCEALARHCQQDGRIVLGFELVYGHAYKGRPRRPSGPPAEAPIALPASRRWRIGSGPA
jgi:malonyl-CoA O-methyltransferase